jgi:hypothetical protein
MENTDPSHLIRLKTQGAKLTTEWREKTHKEFYKEFGHWQYFSGIPSRAKKNWIEQYRKEGV